MSIFMKDRWHWPGQFGRPNTIEQIQDRLREYSAKRPAIPGSSAADGIMPSGEIALPTKVS
jgi:hypothetical protein